MAHLKRRLEDNETETQQAHIEPPIKKRKLDSNPYLNTEDNSDNNEWWKKGNNNNTDDAEEQGKNDLIDYFANIDYVITNESFENTETEQIFIANIIKEMSHFDDTVFIFEHPNISKVIEKVIQILPSFQVRQVIQTFVIPNLFELISKKCSSHVLQTLFAFIPRILIEEQSFDASVNNDKADIQCMGELLSQIIAKLTQFNNKNCGLAQLFIDEKSTFVIRDLLWISCGVVRFNKSKKKKRMSLHNVRKIPSLQKFNLEHVPGSVVQFGTVIGTDIIAYKEQYRLSTHIKHYTGKRDKHSNILCGSLSVLIEALFVTKSNEIMQALIDQILAPPPMKVSKTVKGKSETEKDRNKKHCLELIMNESSSHLVQTMFEFGNKNVCLSVVKHYLNAKDIRDISLDKNGNFALQSMLRRLFDIKSIQFIASSVQHSIATLFAQNRIGVLYCLIDAFTRKGLKPNAIVKTVLSEIKNKKSESDYSNIIYKFLYLNLDKTESKKHLIKSKIMPLSSQYSVLGCLLLQSIVKCNSNFVSEICKAFLALEKAEICQICKDSSGSHVIQAFIESKFVYAEMKWKFLSIFEDRFHALCTDKFGNYIMESCFYCLNFPYKLQFGKKLLSVSAVLKGSRIGLMLYLKMKLDLLKSDERQWRQHILRQKKHTKHSFKSGKKSKSSKGKAKVKNVKNKNVQNVKNVKKVNVKSKKKKWYNNDNSGSNKVRNKNKYKGRKMKKSNKLF